MSPVSVWIAGYSVLLWPVFWLLRLVSVLTYPIIEPTDVWRCITLRISAKFFFNCLFKSLSTAKFSQLCAVPPAVIPCVSGYKDSLVKSLCVGSGFLGNDFFFPSLIQKAVWKGMPKRSLVICVVKFLTYLDKCHVRGILKIYVTFKITRAKRALFFSAFLGKGIHFLSFHFFLLFP